MQEGAHQEDAAPMDLEKPLHYRSEEGLINPKDGGVGVCAPRGLQVIRVGKKRRPGESHGHGDKRIDE